MNLIYVPTTEFIFGLTKYKKHGRLRRLKIESQNYNYKSIDMCSL